MLEYLLVHNDFEDRDKYCITKGIPKTLNRVGVRKKNAYAITVCFI